MTKLLAIAAFYGHDTMRVMDWVGKAAIVDKAMASVDIVQLLQWLNSSKLGASHFGGKTREQLCSRARGGASV
jgi:hypothetical protein